MDHSGTQRTCPECEGRLVAEAEAAETVCTDCGLVVSESDIDTGREWHTPGGRTEDEPSRVGPPSTHLLHDKGLSTTMGWQKQDGSGTALSAERRRKLGRLRRWNERFRTTGSEDRNLRHALGEIDRMASALGIHERTRETASVIYRRALDEGLLPGRSIEGVATAAVYAAGRLCGEDLRQADVASVADISEVTIRNRYPEVLDAADGEP